MDPYNNSIPVTSSSNSDGDSSSDEIKSDDRRAERARSFKLTLDRGVTLAASTPSPQTIGVTRQPVPPSKPTVALPDTGLPMTPALLRLQAEGYPLPMNVAPKIGTESITVPAEVKANCPPTAEPSTAPANELRVTPPHDREREARHHRDRQSGKQTAPSGNAPDPRLVLDPVALPTTKASQSASTPPAGRPMPSPELLQQLVEFATVRHASDGTVEFQLGLVRDALGGALIKLSAYGNRRVGLTIQRGRGNSTIGDEEVAGLIEALRQKNVEVVDVIRG